MPEEYEVHGPHDHAVEHAGHADHHDADPFASCMAVITAVLATIGALCAYQSGNSENLALYYKNEAAIKKTEASNQWSYYQAKGEKQNLAELGAALSAPNSDAHTKFAADVAKYTQQKEPIRAKAEVIEKDVVDNDAKSEALLHGHHRWAQATTLIQVAIALCAITLLTRKKWLRNLSFVVAAAGVMTGAVAFFSA
ncbi:MAG: Putative transmembrane protein [uncultured Paraburkholderia sp.]|nr:MAG: Putative transmembrane protein [uncultured Paraburkholderia sp.]CAH2924515.1 MAG: Putative transmembrane protein [uncultured Paraburkholderia sp.]